MTIDRRRAQPQAERVLFGHVEGSTLAVHGYVLDPEREAEALVVELLLDGVPHEVLRADLFDAALAGEGARNPYHGFRFVLPSSVAARGAVAEIRLANDGTLIGNSLDLAARSEPLAAAWAPGSVSWLGGLKFGGWLAQPAGGDMVLRGLVDDNLVAEARPRGWVGIERNGATLTVPAFELDLPARFADGRAHRLEVVTSGGETLPPGPVPFVAFADGLAAFLARQSDVASEQLRGALYDRLIPQSLPFEAFADWSQRFDRPGGPALARPVAVVLIGDDHLEASLDSLGEQADPWVAGVMTVRGEATEFDPADLIAFLEAEAADCEVVVFALGGTVFLPGALGRVGRPLVADRTVDCAYTDVVATREDGRRLVPLCLPAFDRERTIEQGYAASFFALSRPAALAAGRGGANSLFRLFLSGSGVEGAGRRVPLHVPGFAARVPPLSDARTAAALLAGARHVCAAQAVPARVEPVAAARFRPTVRVRRRPAPCLVSVIILVRNGADDLRRCLAALKAQETANDLEIIVVDNDSSSRDTADLLSEIASDGVQIVRVRGPRNVARAVNCGAGIASGAALLILDQAVALTSPDAVDEMLGRCAAQGTGAVGGVLTWPSGVVLEAGLVTTFGAGTAPAFRGHGADDPGYADTLLAAREVSAVSGAFMMLGREAFAAAGGMDEAVFPLFFPAPALCLALAGLGYRSVLTPYARASWHGAPDDGERTGEPAARFERELQHLRTAWPDALAGDPFYNPILNLDGRLHAGLAWPPRALSPRRPAARAGEGARPVAEGPPIAVGRRRSQGEAR